MGLGNSTIVGIGGDPIVGSSFIDVLEKFEADPQTEYVVMVGEIGGDEEEKAAAFIEANMTQAGRRLHRRLHRAARQDDGPRRRDHLRLVRHRRGQEAGARGEGHPRRHLARPRPRRSSPRSRGAELTADGLFCLDVGAGPPLVVVHGGPEFDHSYLRPELDRLAGSFRVVYYDQRGRGRSAEGVRPGDVSLRSEIEDLERVRSERGLESVAVLGHSWGGVLGMEYAVRHPERVSHLILMGTAPASAGDWRLLREAFARNRPAADQEAMDALASSDAFARGDREAEAAFYRIHFRMTLRRSRSARDARGAPTVELHGGRRPARAGDHAPTLRRDLPVG